MATSSSHVKAYLVGGGIASLAAAVYLIRDGGVPGTNITIFDEQKSLGGSLDAAGSAETGYSLRGGRMFEAKFRCTYGLLDSIPSLGNPAISAKDELFIFHEQFPWYARARLIDREGRKIDVTKLGLGKADQKALKRLILSRESALGAQKISDWFGESFFQSNFWWMWSSMFAFLPWHSLAEHRRYLLRFFHLFSSINTLSGIYRTKYTQYDSMVVPISRWLRERGVVFQSETQVLDLEFRPGAATLVTAIRYRQAGKEITIPVAESDLVMVTNGSMTANSSLGSMTAAPKLDTGKSGGSWALWENLAAKRPGMGNPAAFRSNIDATKWESFTVTSRSRTFFDFMEDYSGSPAGTGALYTLKGSSWMITFSLNRTPYLASQPADAFVWWGCGLYPDRVGDYVRKRMSDCTGEEILEEVFCHLKIAETERRALIEQSISIPCMMPYITSQFMPRAAGDRPLVVPKDSRNLAFLGQFAEVPKDTVFTVEYSVRTAQVAVYRLLGLKRKPNRLYKGYLRPRHLLAAAMAMRK